MVLMTRSGFSEAWKWKKKGGLGDEKVRGCDQDTRQMQEVYFLPVERSSLESVCSASMISEKVPWEQKWLHETGGQRRRGDNIKQMPEARVPWPLRCTQSVRPDLVKLNTCNLCALSSCRQTSCRGAFLRTSFQNNGAVSLPS